MTVQARLVLSDCERLLAEIQKDMPTELWRPRWAGLVALLRAVGHVLHNVDSRDSGKAKQVIEARWNDLLKSKPEPKIFWEFIAKERNIVLKMYEVSAGVNVTARPGTIYLNLATGQQHSSPSGPTTFDGFMRAGHFAGKDPLVLCRDAIEFWRAYLDLIDLQLEERN